MSILQIEISDETRARLEAQAQSEGRDAGSWLVEVAEHALQLRQQEQEAKRQALARHLLQRVAEPSVEATPQWWEEVLAQGLADAGRRTEEPSVERTT